MWISCGQAHSAESLYVCAYAYVYIYIYISVWSRLWSSPQNSPMLYCIQTAYCSGGSSVIYWWEKPLNMLCVNVSCVANETIIDVFHHLTIHCVLVRQWSPHQYSLACNYMFTLWAGCIYGGEFPKCAEEPPSHIMIVCLMLSFVEPFPKRCAWFGLSSKLCLFGLNRNRDPFLITM